MSDELTEADLEAYLDEALDPAQAAEIERQAREQPELMARLVQINRRRNAGVHTLGEIWRRYQIGVPTREEMSEFLLGVLPDDHADYIQFRLDMLKCPYTRALYRDLSDQQKASDAPATRDRRKKIYRSSAGLLKPDDSR